MKWGGGVEGEERGGGVVEPPFEKEPDTALRRFPKRAYIQMDTIYVYNMNTYIHIHIHAYIYMCVYQRSTHANRHHNGESLHPSAA